MTPLLGFTAEQVSRLTGLSQRQLRYWDRTDFFRPAYMDVPRRPYGRIYSFRDVVGLRTLGVLRRRHHVSLQELRKVGAWLRRHYDEPWSRLRFYVAGREVFFDDPELGVRRAGSKPGQTVFTFELHEVAAATAVDAGKLRQRSDDEIGRVVRNRYVSHNAPVLAGTRVRTEAVWKFHQAGYDVESILRQYPRLTAADVEAAIAFEQERRQSAAG